MGNVSTVIDPLTRDTWHHVDIVLNYSTPTFSVVLDGSKLASGLAFCADNSRTSNGAPVTAMGWTCSTLSVAGTISGP